MRNHLHFRFQGDWWCIMYLQAWHFLAGCGVRGDLGGLPWGVACSSLLPRASACLPVRGCWWVCKHQVRLGFSPHQPGLCFPVPSYICPVCVKLIHEPDLIKNKGPLFCSQIQFSLFESLGAWSGFPVSSSLLP